jgi:site-specific DNA-methyltransferase (adenine-specific)
MLEINKTYLGDCLELMKDIDDNSVDMILCDLPYGTTACRWDVIIPFNKLWEQYKRIIKHKSAIILFGSEPFSSHLRLSNLSWFRYDIVWNKKKPSNFQMMNFQPGRIHEMIHVFSEGKAVFSRGNHMKYYPIKTLLDKPYYDGQLRGTKNSTLRINNTIKDLGKRLYIDKHPTSIIEFTNANIKIKQHPTEKPLPLCEYLIKTYSLENELILDNCCGSGNTGRAAKNLNRNYIMMEKEEEYYKIAKERVGEV